jgi:DNA polymerase elongation subunit (family B)
VKEYKFVKRWVNHNTRLIMQMYPELKKDEVKKVIRDFLDETIVNQKCMIHNNYVGKTIDLTLLDLIDWIEDTKPVVAGYGVFFKNQNHTLNPAAVMLDGFLTLRKKYKKELHNYLEGSYLYKYYDRMQLNEKINANSYYGVSGADVSDFFNLYTATSTTATGQS